MRSYHLLDCFIANKEEYSIIFKARRIHIMKMKQSFFYTLRENVKDEDSTSGNLLTRAGMIKKSSAGVYMMLPLGYKVLNNIENILRSEMNAIDSQELTMPALISEEVFIASGRRENFGSSMFSLKDRFNKPFVLGPTHEELFVQAAAMKIRSYKDMPFSLYQFQTKYRDEPRPRFGLIRVREFVMKDAYTFDVDAQGLDVAYNNMYNAYKNTFDKIGLDYRIVKADTGVMGGLLSEEFQAISDIGEDILVLCEQCDYSSNIEITACVDPEIKPLGNPLPLEKVVTPNFKTIEEVSSFFKKDATHFVKTLIYSVDNKPYACLVRGDREINETKLQKLLQANEITLATPELVYEVSQAQVGFAGPVNIKCPVIIDKEVSQMVNFIVGANETDYHYINCNIKDFTTLHTADIRKIQEGDICPKCRGTISFAKGIEVGNTFKLGTKYAEALNLTYLDQNNKLNPVWMGSYGIGTARCMAAIVEQHHDEYGIIWPKSVAPYKVAIVMISSKDEQQATIANELYRELSKQWDVLLDDRDERPGVKFKDLDLIGIPLRIVIGKKCGEGLVEIKERTAESAKEIALTEVHTFVEEFMK